MYYINGAKQNKIFVHELSPFGKQTILMLHGWPLDHRIFEYLSYALAEADFRCVMMDFRGFGSSDVIWNSYDYDSLAADVAAVVNAMHLENFILLGFSMGAAVALRYMSNYKSWQVKKLALISAAAPSFTRKADFPYGLSKAHMSNYLDLISKDRFRFNSEFGKLFFSNRASVSMRNWLQSVCNDASLIGTLNCGLSLRDEDSRADLSAVQVPCGIFHGRMDRICPFEFALEIQKSIGHAKLYPFQQIGHSIILEDHLRLSSQLISFANEQ